MLRKASLVFLVVVGGVASFVVHQIYYAAAMTVLFR